MGGTVEEIPKVYDEERSPLFNAKKIEKPLLVSVKELMAFSIRYILYYIDCRITQQILQGSEDKVVPPQQAEEIVAKIQACGGKVKYVLFQGEGHGFRQPENIKNALESEIAWYEEVLGLTA